MLLREIREPLSLYYLCDTNGSGSSDLWNKEMEIEIRSTHAIKPLQIQHYQLEMTLINLSYSSFMKASGRKHILVPTLCTG